MQELLVLYKKQIIFALIGILLLSVAILISKKDSFESNKVEILSSSPPGVAMIKAEIAGAVINPGVYSLSSTARVDDLIAQAGGFTSQADMDYVAKTINRAATVKDAQKVYIPQVNQPASMRGEQSEVLSSIDNVQVSNLININQATQSELETLWGIGPVTGQKIIEQRPYSSIEELLSKKIIKQNVYDKIKDQISVY